MKKCLIFFTLLLITLAIAIVLQNQEHLNDVNDVALRDAPSNDILAKEQALVLD